MSAPSRPRPTPPAVVVGGIIGALSVTRSLARSGVPVHVLSPALQHSALRRSRFPAAVVRFFDKDAVQDDWLAWLETNGPEGAALIPCDDDALELIARHRARLVELGYRPFEANDAVALEMLDKARIYDLAAEVGVAAPVSVRLQEEDDLDRAAAVMRFPCALKPMHSHLAGRHFPQKAIVVDDADELRRTWEPMRAVGLHVIATEIVNPASEECVGYMTYLDEEGEPLFAFTKAKVRQHPTRFGTGCYHVTGWMPDVAEAGERFFRGVGVRGLAYVEFKRALDGTPKIVDVNHRFLDSTEVVRRSGIDVARLVYDRLTGGEVRIPSSFREDVRLWFALEDTRAFLDQRRRGSLGFATWARSLAGRQHFPIFAWDDPLPSVSDAAWIVGRAVRKAGRILRG